MKKAIYLLLTGLLAVCFFSCMKQDDIYKQFVVPGGLTYPQKVDTLIVRSGYNKLEIVWPKTIDPSVVKARLFWNAGQDSLDVDMTSVTDSAKIVMENLNEESYTFSVYTYDAKGNRSMVTEQAGMPYGDKYLSSKSLKEITSAAMLTTTAALFNFSPAVSDLKYCEFTYTSTSGEEKTVTLEADAKSLQITDFQNGAPYRIRSIYKPEKGIDEIPGEWVEAQETLEMEVIDLPKSPWQQFALPGGTEDGVSTCMRCGTTPPETSGLRRNGNIPGIPGSPSTWAIPSPSPKCRSGTASRMRRMTEAASATSRYGRAPNRPPTEDSTAGPLSVSSRPTSLPDTSRTDRPAP